MGSEFTGGKCARGACFSDGGRDSSIGGGESDDASDLKGDGGERDMVDN